MLQHNGGSVDRVVFTTVGYLGSRESRSSACCRRLVFIRSNAMILIRREALSFAFSSSCRIKSATSCPNWGGANTMIELVSSSISSVRMGPLDAALMVRRSVAS